MRRIVRDPRKQRPTVLVVDRRRHICAGCAIVHATTETIMGTWKGVERTCELCELPCVAGFVWRQTVQVEKLARLPGVRVRP